MCKSKQGHCLALKQSFHILFKNEATCQSILSGINSRKKQEAEASKTLGMNKWKMSVGYTIEVYLCDTHFHQLLRFFHFL